MEKWRMYMCSSTLVAFFSKTSNVEEKKKKGILQFFLCFNKKWIYVMINLSWFSSQCSRRDTCGGVKWIMTGLHNLALSLEYRLGGASRGREWTHFYLRNRQNGKLWPVLQYFLETCGDSFLNCKCSFDIPLLYLRKVSSFLLILSNESIPR